MNPKNKKLNLLRFLLSKNWNKGKHSSCPKIKKLRENIFQLWRKIKKKIAKVKNTLKSYIFKNHYCTMLVEKSKN